MAKKKTTKKINNNIKKEHTKVMNSISNRDNEVSKVIKCIIVVLVIFAIAYLLTIYITKNSTDSVVKKELENTSIQYDEILAGTSFSKKDSEYLVLFYNVSEDENSTYDSLKSTYEAKKDAIPMYYVDLGSSLNKDCVSTEANKDATSSSELKINDATLIKFTDNKISEYMIGEEEISNYLNK